MINTECAEETAPAVSRLRKARKIADYLWAFKNPILCLRLRKAVGRPTGKLRRVCFRNGLRMDVRMGTPDISILWEVLLGGAYASAETLIKEAGQPCSVIDLGANIGAFTLRCARASPDVMVESYEPGPQNAVMVRRNIRLNAQLSPRVRFHEEAVAQSTGTAYWHFDEANPGGSSLHGSQEGVAVQTRSFAEVLARCTRPVAFVKIDVEGSEYALLDGAGRDDWKQVPAVFVELHPDPASRSSPDAWLNRMVEHGFKHQQREFSSLLLRR